MHFTIILIVFFTLLQDAFTFLSNFITDLSTTKSAESPSTESKKAYPVYVLVNIASLYTEIIEQPSPSSDQSTDTESDVTVDPTYFKEFSFYPSLVVKIDYEAKRFDMEKVNFKYFLLVHLQVSIKQYNSTV